MPFSFSHYSGLLLIFVVHGFVYAFLLLRRGIRNDRGSDRWLSLFLLLCVLYISPWMLGFAGWYEGDECFTCRNFMFYMPFQHTLLMGPVIYFYLRGLFQPALKFTRRDWLHFIPGFLYLVWCAIVFITDRLVLKRYYLMDGVQDPDFDNWYVTLGLLSLLIYLILCIRYYRRYKRFIVQQASFADEIIFKWVRNFLLAFFIYFALNLSFHLVQFFGVEVNYTTNWWYYLLFGLLLYYITINGYTNAIESRTQLSLDLLAYENTAALQETGVEPIALPDETKPVSAKEAVELEEWKQKLVEAVQVQKAYVNPELTLPQLASQLQTNTAFLSKLINSGFGQNFNDFINYYRVEDVKQKLLSGAAGEVTIMSLAHDAGFNSKATFNRAFKKLTGKNPSAFLEGR